MLTTGSLFAGRYLINNKIGSGGMADVYRVYDRIGDREAALKVLKAELSDDREFVKRFEDEGRAVSLLSGPNIIETYDVGNDNGTYYIVMELVIGITLKEYIDKNGMLSARETMAIASQVAVGLRSAHAHHIIHRDIKPQNIILSKDKKVKVADFGIARALTDETKAINNTTMGSVHYISPEQAKGAVCDERSDIYSLGICMYEMITGQVPFDKETTIAVALAHMNEMMVAPSDLNPSCPLALEQIIYRCTQKSRERRYHNCTELLQDLKIAVENPDYNFEKREKETFLKSDTHVFSKSEVEGIRRVAELGTFGGELSDEENETGFDQEDTDDEEIDTVFMNSQRVSQFIVSGDNMDDEESEGTVTDNASDFREVHVRPSDKKTDLFDEDRKEDEKSLFDRVILILGIFFAAIALCLIIYIAATFSGCIHRANRPAESSASSEHETNSNTSMEETSSLETIPEKNFNPETDTLVPKVVGMSLKDAVNTLKEAGLDFKISSEVIYSDEYPAKTICKQSYNEGTRVRKGSVIYIMMSDGPDYFVIKKKHTGMSVEKFKSELGTLTNLIEVEFVKALSDQIPVGEIISIDPKEGKVKRGEKITVTYCAGPEYVQVPNLLGKTKEEAFYELENNGLSRGEVSENYSDTYEAGRVMAQSYMPGEKVKNGSPVSIEVSLGIHTAAIPALIGEPVDTAVEALTELGFLVNVVDDYENNGSPNTVIALSPEAGSEVKVGEEVTVTVAREKEKVLMPDLTGSLFDEAKEALEAMGLTVAEPVYKDTDDPNYNDLVRSQSVKKNRQVTVGTEITLTVYRYIQKTITMINVTGAEEEEAVDLIKSIGLTVNVVYEETDDPDLNRLVKDQSVAEGTEAEPGTEVILTVWHYRAPETTEPETSETETSVPETSETEKTSETGQSESSENADGDGE